MCLNKQTCNFEHYCTLSISASTAFAFFHYWLPKCFWCTDIDCLGIHFLHLPVKIDMLTIASVCKCQMKSKHTTAILLAYSFNYSTQFNFILSVLPCHAIEICLQNCKISITISCSIQKTTLNHIRKPKLSRALVGFQLVCCFAVAKIFLFSICWIFGLLGLTDWLTDFVL